VEKYVDDEINVVQHHPAGLGIPRFAVAWDPVDLQLLFHGAEHSLQVRRAESGRNQKVVRNTGALMHVQERDVFPFLVSENAGGFSCDV
jgi:hypothetical protein